jgi:hypothetical protein
MKLTKTILMRGIMPAIVLAFFVSGTNLLADYQTDQDIQKAAQKLKDTEDAQRAADQREASKREYGQDAPQINSHETFITVMIIVGGIACSIMAMIEGAKKKR